MGGDKNREREIKAVNNDDHAKRRGAAESHSQDRSEIDPNAETVAAMEEARTRKLKSFNSVEALMEDLNAEE